MPVVQVLRQISPHPNPMLRVFKSSSKSMQELVQRVVTHHSLAARSPWGKADLRQRLAREQTIMLNPYVNL